MDDGYPGAVTGPGTDVDRVLSDKALLGRSGFARGSALYERARPGYSDQVVDLSLIHI